MIPTSIDGTDITGATIDGTDVQEITVDGDTVFSAVVDGFAPSGTVLAQYRIDTTSGATVADVTGNEFGFDVVGASLVTDSDLIDDTGLDFDGVNDELKGDNEFFSFQNFNATTDEFSMLMTVEFDDVSADQNLFSMGANSQNSTFDSFGFGISTSVSGLLTARATEQSSFSGPQSQISGLTANTKMRVGFRFNAMSQLDTILNKNIGSSGGSPRLDKVGGTYIASRDGAFFADATIDNVVFYDGFISQTVIDEDYDAQQWTP